MMNTHLPNTASTTVEQISLRSTVDLLSLLWRRRLHVAVGLAIGILLGAIFYIQATPMYQSSAEVLVVPKRPGVVTGEQRYESHFVDYVATHQALIVSPLIIQRAIETSDLAALNTFTDADPEWLVETIQAQLEVGGGPRNLGENADSIMNLSFQGPEPDDSPVVVQAILDSYKAFLDETYRGMSDDTAVLISQARDLLQNDLQQQEEMYSQFRQQSPLVSRGTDEINPLQDRLIAIETQRSDLLIRRIEIERQLQAIQHTKEGGKDNQQLLAVVSDLRQRATTENSLPNLSTGLDNQLFALMDREHQLLEHYGENHPRVVTVRQQIGTTRQFYALPTAAHVPQREPSVHGPDDAPATMDPVASYVEYLKQELERSRIAEKLLTELYEREHKAAKELSSYQLKDERFQRNMDRTQQLYDGVVSQLQQASLIKDYGGFEARVIGPPRAGTKVSPSIWIVLAGSLLGGMLLGTSLAMLIEVTDRSFHSREEIQTQLGLSVVGQIPQMDPAESPQPDATNDVPLDPLLCTFFQPRSLSTEAYRALRNALYFSRQGATQRVIQVTGPSPDEGNSTVAANLAISIAQSGKQTLLIDADLRRPRQHEIFGMSPPPESGLASIVALDDELDDAIRETVVDNLWLLPAGQLPSDPSGLFVSPRFPELIHAVREKYDYVLIDTGPLLVVSDPCVVASQADGVLLVLRLTKNSRSRAMRAKDILDTLETKQLGLVANGIGGTGARGYRDEMFGFHVGYYEHGNGTASSQNVSDVTT